MNVKGKCPSCGYVFDAQSAPFTGADAKPVDGDVCICVACHCANVFRSDGTIRRPSEYELLKIMSDPHVAELVTALDDMKKPKSPT